MDVTGIDDFSAGADNVQYLGDVRIIKGDLTNATFLSHVFSRHSFDVVYHLWDVASVRTSHVVPTQTYLHNMVGTSGLVSEAVKANVQHFVLLSSIAVYGDLDGPWSETSPTRPSSPYGISKLAAEQHVLAASARFGLKASVLRVHGLYGPRMALDPENGNIVARAIATALLGAASGTKASAAQKRQPTYIDDVIPMIAMAPFVVPADANVINIGSDEIVSVQEVVSAAAAAAGVDSKRGTSEGANEGQEEIVQHMQAVHDRSRCIFRVGKHTPFLVGMEATIEWARDAGLPALRGATAFVMEPEIDLTVLKTAKDVPVPRN